MKWIHKIPTSSLKLLWTNDHKQPFYWARVWPINRVLTHKKIKIPRFDPQEKSLVRRFDPLKISGTASKFNTTYQK